MGTVYEIRVRGRLSPGWSAWFAGMQVSPLPDGDTLLRGEVGDQAALFGLLARVRDLGLALVLVQEVAGEGEPVAQPSHQR